VNNSERRAEGLTAARFMGVLQCGTYRYTWSWTARSARNE